MKFREYLTGAKIVYMGEDYILRKVDAPNVYLSRISDGADKKISLTDLLKNSDATVFHENINAIATPIYDKLSEKKRDEYNKRREIIQPLLDYQRAKEVGDLPSFIESYPELFAKDTDYSTLLQSDVSAAVARHNKTSARSVDRYLSRYKEGVRKGLDPAETLPSEERDGSTKRKDSNAIIIRNPKHPDEILDVINVRLGAEQAEIVQDQLSKKYLTKLRCSAKEVIDTIQGICAIRKIAPPKEGTLYSIIGRIDKRIEILTREPKNKQYQVADTELGYTNETTLYPLHKVAMDHNLLDVLVVDEVTGEVIGRPYLSLAMDLFCRGDWGFHLSFDPPSINSVIKVLENGLFVKNYREEYGLKNEWVICGKPSILILDNAKEFKSPSSRRIFLNMGCTVLFRPIRVPHYCGPIERKFETINAELIHRMPGTTKSNPAQLGEIKPEDYARMTMRELKKFLLRYLVDVYPYEEHSGLPDYANTPMARYYHGISNFGIPQFIDPADEELVRVELMRQETKQYVRGSGITFQTIRYKLDSLAGLIQPGKEYLIKYDDDDISYILLLHPKTLEYVRVPAVQPSDFDLTGMSRFQYNIIIKKMRQEGKLRNNCIPGCQTFRTSMAELMSDLEKVRNTSVTARQILARIQKVNDAQRHDHQNLEDLDLDYLRNAALQYDISTSLQQNAQEGK